MAERHLYNDKLEFEGSMDDYGNIYDERHSLIGHVDGNTIYDSCNVPHGHINADGQVTDMCNIPTGQEFGASFKGWNGNGSGLVRNDVLGSGHGNDYGIFLRVKNANRRYGIDDGSEESGDKDDGDKQEDSEYDTNDYSGDDEWEGYSRPCPSREKYRRVRRNRLNEHQNEDILDEVGCVVFLLVVLFFTAIIWYLLATEVHL